MKQFLIVAAATMMFGAAPVMAQSYGGYSGQGSYRGDSHAGRSNGGYGYGYGYGQPSNGRGYYDGGYDRRAYNYNDRNYRNDRHERGEHRQERREHGSRGGYRGW